MSILFIFTIISYFLLCLNSIYFSYVGFCITDYGTLEGSVWYDKDNPVGICDFVISLSFLNSTSAYLGTWPISEKMREQCDLCEDTFLSASFLNYHMSKQHKESCELSQCKDTFYQANFTIPCHHQQKSARLNQQINLLQELPDPSW